ncbi:MAG: hypothetical protein NTW87_32520 [Planctomycetota bacterium]|nr:hypothetical protein [Planctomycetota bacterium]
MITGVINPERYAAAYEGLLRAPVSGDYKFSVDTPGIAHLLVNGIPVLGVGAPDAKRQPFTLTGTLRLAEGLHRVTLYYAEATPAGETNMKLGLFGVRLHWQPPFARDFLCIPPQAFVHHLPAVVTRMESGSNSPQPFIHVENLGQVRAGAYRGDRLACERVMLMATAVGAVPGARLKATAPGMSEVVGTPGAALAVWVSAGREAKLALVGPDNQSIMAARTASFPVLGKTSPELLDLEGELVLKAAPDFLYPDENGHIHLEAMLSPPPMIVFKERLECKPPALPPAPRPMGQYRLAWSLQDAARNGAVAAAEEYDATPLEGPRRKRRVSLEAGPLEEQVRGGGVQMLIRLFVGDAEVETMPLRLLHASAPWPGAIEAGPDHLLFRPGSAAKAEPASGAASTDPVPAERVIVIVAKENEAEYRKFAPLRKSLAREAAGKEALFIGDPLVEGVPEKSDPSQLFGVAQALATATPKIAWQSVSTAGPHRHLPLFRMLAGLDEFVRSQADGKAPAIAVVCLGGGDVARQTPVHTFERALDVLIDRLRLAGVRAIVVAGVIPEPTREHQCEPYQDRVLDVLRQHHADSVDVYNAWARETDWTWRYALDRARDARAFGPVPNSQAREEIARMIKDRL